jgi:RNA polymerase sigma factor (sigma-70 family)
MIPPGRNLLTYRVVQRPVGEEHMSTLPVISASGESLTQEFEEIFRAYAPLMYRTAFIVTASRQDAEDVLQTIFLKLLQRETPIEFRTSPKSYLYRASVNLALDVVRAKKRRTFTHEVDLLGIPAPEDESHRDEAMRRCLQDAIAQLKPRAVEVLILRYEYGHSDAEIAKMLRKSRGTIAVTLYRARARLKKFMLRALSSGENQ